MTSLGTSARKLDHNSHRSVPPRIEQALSTRSREGCTLRQICDGILRTPSVTGAFRGLTQDESLSAVMVSRAGHKTSHATQAITAAIATTPAQCLDNGSTGPFYALTIFGASIAATFFPAPRGSSGAEQAQ